MGQCSVLIVLTVVALALAACTTSTPSSTNSGQWGGGTGTQLTTPTPVPADPIPGQSQTVLDSQARDELRRREVMENFPERMKTWIDEDTIVYLVLRDAHNLEGELVAVAHDMPTGTARSYELGTSSDGQVSISLYTEKTRGGSRGEAAALRLEQDPRVADAALQLLTTVERWSQ